MQIPSEEEKDVVEHGAAQEESKYLLKDRANIAYDGVIMLRLVSFLRC